MPGFCKGNPGVGRTSISRLFLFFSHPPCFVAGQRDFGKAASVFPQARESSPQSRGRVGIPHSEKVKTLLKL